MSNPSKRHLYRKRRRHSSWGPPLLALVVALFSPPAAGATDVGCWWKQGQPPPELGSFCDFFLLKRGVFSQRGRLSPRHAHGKNPEKHTAWITHRIGPLRETLSAAAGTQLGKELKGIAGAIELDIEPLPSARDWLPPFLTAVKQALPTTPLTLAVPFFSEKPETVVSWTEESFRKVLPAVDGLDIMVYDTGAETPVAYEAILERNLALATRLAAEFPQKHFRLGLPAYPDKTRRHRPQVENLPNALEVIKKRGPLPASIGFAIYAGWTLTERDKLTLASLRTLLRREPPGDP